MQSLIFDQVSFAYSGGDEVLRDISFTCTRGWTALVGGNGAGKSTLLAIAAGTLAPTRGFVRRAHLATCVLVDQRVEAADDAVHELAWSYDRAANRLRARFHLGDDDVARWTTLSPGERKRWQLAAALAREPDLLIVDEPSNHLDAELLAHAADALAEHAGVGLIVSHDRALLDRLASQTVRLDAGRARPSPGGYTEARATWEAEEAAARTKRELLAKDRRKAERLLDDQRRAEAAATRNTSTGTRMKSPKDSDARGILATTAASWAATKAGRGVQTAHTRVEAARTAEEAVTVTRARGAALAFAGEAAARRWVVQLDLSALAVGERTLLTDVHVALGREDRVWLRGPNGSGKTTLVTALLAACTLAPDKVFVLPQELTADASQALAAQIRGLDRATRGRLGQLVDALGVDPDRATRSAQPSPGETRKLALALGLVREPHLLVLDEPTNHLDVDSIERLQAALAGFPGAMLVVSHDERFAGDLCPVRWTLSDGRLA